MEKRFVLVIQYECGKCAMLTDTPDMTQALAQFNKIHLQRYGVDKSSLAPKVVALELYPLLYESVYGG